MPEREEPRGGGAQAIGVSRLSCRVFCTVVTSIISMLFLYLPVVIGWEWGANEQYWPTTPGYRLAGHLCIALHSTT